MFSFEALKAHHGDALLVHYGNEDNPRTILIDGGPNDVWEESLDPRLQDIAFNRGIDRVQARLAMVSHIDNDHITGINDMMRHLRDDAAIDHVVNVQSLWHNSFDTLIGNSELAMLADLGNQAGAGAAGLGTDLYGLSIAAGVGAGKSLRTLAGQLALTVNSGGTSIGGFIAEGDSVNLGLGTTMRVLNPDVGQLEALELKWDGVASKLSNLTPLQRRRALASISDDSLANISSIVVLLRRKGRTMLLTGDARGDQIIGGLARAGQIKNGRAKVNILKLPHHGSDRNVDSNFFKVVRADHYVFSGDQDPQFGSNPDKAAFTWLVSERGAQRYTMHFTYLKPKIQQWIQEDRANNTRNYTVNSTPSGELGLWIDLEEPLWF